MNRRSFSSTAAAAPRMFFAVIAVLYYAVRVVKLSLPGTLMKTS